jgi:hypothetical protein
MTDHTNKDDTMINVGHQLVELNVSIQDLIDKTGLSPAQFYRDFREEFGCTPTEHRERTRQEKKDREEKIVREETFNFMVSLQQAANTPHITNQHHQRPVNSELMVPLIVNGQFGFTAYVVTISGKCPTSDGVEFLRSEYRDMFNAMVVDTLMPYFHGKVNIAYLQTLNSGPMVQRPYGAWQ